MRREMYKAGTDPSGMQNHICRRCLQENPWNLRLLTESITKKTGKKHFDFWLRSDSDARQIPAMEVRVRVSWKTTTAIMVGTITPSFINVVDNTMPFRFILTWSRIKLTRYIIPLMSPIPIGKITPSENADVLTRKPNNMANKIQTA